MPQQAIIQFEYSNVMDPKTRELCALSASAAVSCSP